MTVRGHRWFVEVWTVSTTGAGWQDADVLFPNADLDRIASGEIDLAFRTWTRPMHVAGGRQRTRIGVVEFTEVAKVDPAELTDEDARRAGTDLARLRAFLSRKDGDVYRVGVRFAGADERVALRAKRPGRRQVAEVLDRLAAMDRRSRRGPWTREHLELIEARPAELAETIAASIGREKKPFKADVRRLKELGLTESLPVGYRLSPRGRAVLEALRGL
ncbi:hypothetical protein SAMN04487968_101172 [Nocardioides terrae]|uniref:ASCH domain-containing protein n=1 Tax=Nocardioides terrae TaxID=574651 RepID=A0A1I1DCR2_9ACTN|nr:hypothetical protein [Nocardioides terrae]SFB72735.1 hypothetical protein SAMN04487968_101172 [Nocardioides terrae]